MASELLKRAYKATLTNAETVLLNGVDGHTYTILSITLCETAGAAETFDLYIDIGGAGTDILPHYTFGVGYEIIDGLTTNFEYCMTPDATATQQAAATGNANAEERLRLSLSVSF